MCRFRRGLVLLIMVRGWFLVMGCRLRVGRVIRFRRFIGLRVRRVLMMWGLCGGALVMVMILRFGSCGVLILIWVLMIDNCRRMFRRAFVSGRRRRIRGT